jgi:ribosomal protein L40E
MPSYYEILQIAPSAGAAEIETAYETQYNQWRRLVTHHDPDIVNQANQALQALEKIRATLADPVRRAAYNEGIGIGGVSGGLADPNAMLRAIQPPAAPPPPLPNAPTATQVVAPPTGLASGLWACAKCGTDNPAQTKFCFKCGNQLVRKCPACGKEASLIATGRCGECGVDYDEAMHRNDVKRQIGLLQKEIGEKEAEHAEALAGAKDSALAGLGAVIAVVGIVFIFVTITTSFVGVLFGLLLIGVGGAMIFNGRNTLRQFTSQAEMVQQHINQLQSQMQQLNAELGLVADYSSVLACTNCGSENPQNAKFCTKCGYQFAP